jgi:peptidoglycan/xylan/chitin deacetylase (PgdA/CDA1 family)
VFQALKRFTSFLAASLIAGSIIAHTGLVLAAVSNPTPAAKISFTFDDGYSSVLSQAAPTLAKYGLKGTSYVITGCVGMIKAPNTCKANTDKTYLTWAQIKSLQNTYGWEIGSHTVTHPYLASTDPEEQPTKLTAAQVTQELANSKAALAAQGITANAFATPYGDYDMPVLAQIAKYYSTMRGFADQNNNIWPHNDYLLNDMQVQSGVTVAQVKARIDQAITNKQWLILTMHDVNTKPSTNPDDYEYKTSDLDQIAAYVKTKQTAGLIQNMTVSQGTVNSDTNLLPNSSFDSGIAAGWTTDSPSTITKDSANNGSFPSSTNAIKLTSASTTKHLFSPKVPVASTTNYLLKNFLNVQTITSGEVGFYIDEYDANGNWISGQYKTGEHSVFVEGLNFTYKPSSPAVTQASLQVIVTGNSGIKAYLDNSQWFALDSSTPPPAPTNLMGNGTFDAGISAGWSTNSPTSITADNQNNGSPANPVNSVKLTSTTRERHLFSPQIAVDATQAYTISSYLNVKQLTSGEVGYYIDEYDANGNWISGQYKTGVRGVGTNTVMLSYKATSANVKKASLQIIVTANSGLLAYFDNVVWSL